MPSAPADNVDLVFRAFSDRTRLRLLSLLAGGREICVCDLMRVTGLPQAKVSRHLSILRAAGLVVGRRDKQWMHYRLLEPRDSFRRKLLECLDCCLGEVPMLREDRRRLGHTQPEGRGAPACCAPSKGCR